MAEVFVLIIGVVLCMFGLLAGTVTLRTHPRLQRYAILIGVTLMAIATVWAVVDPATWAVR